MTYLLDSYACIGYLRGVDSLEATIRSRLTAESLPVLTLADAERFRNDRQYADRVVASLLEILFETSLNRRRARNPHTQP